MVKRKGAEIIQLPSRYPANGKLRTSFVLNQGASQNNMGSRTVVVAYNQAADVEDIRMGSVTEELFCGNGQILTEEKDRKCTRPSC